MPTDATAYVWRDSACETEAEADKAISDRTEAIQPDPRNSYACGNRGRACANKRELDRAICGEDEALRLASRMRVNFLPYASGIS
jgi:hypothetical protein